MSLSWHEKYRPTTPDGLVGAKQQATARFLLNTVPENARQKSWAGGDEGPTPKQLVFLTGESGTGKTTVARMYAAALGDYTYVNCADLSVEQIRGSLAQMKVAPPLAGGYHVVVWDELDGLSAPAQRKLLDIEDLPPWVVIIAATKNDEKLRSDLRSRFYTAHFPIPTREEIGRHLIHIFEQEGFDYKTNRDKITAIINRGGGNLRQIITDAELLSSGVDIAEDDEMDDAGKELWRLLTYGDASPFAALPLIRRLSSIQGFVIGLLRHCIKNQTERGMLLLDVFGADFPDKQPEDIWLAHKIIQVHKYIKGEQ